MLIKSAFAAWRHVFSPAFRAIFWRTLALTLGFLVVVWVGLAKVLSGYVTANAISTSYPLVDGLATFLAGTGLFFVLAYLLPAISIVVAGFFLDEAADKVEREDFPHEPKGQALGWWPSLVWGAQFAGLSLAVNLAALTLFFVPVVNIFAFFLANTYLLGREYFSLAAGRFHSREEVARLRLLHKPTILMAGAMMAALLLVPLLNLLTPLFGVAFMVHVHKNLHPRQPAMASISPS